jgi:hypothetical protein
MYRLPAYHNNDEDPAPKPVQPPSQQEKDGDIKDKENYTQADPDSGSVEKSGSFSGFHRGIRVHTSPVIILKAV